MRIVRYIAVLIIVVALGILLYSKAIAIIYLICTIVAVLAFVAFVFVYCSRYYDELNEPKKVVVEGTHYYSSKGEPLFTEYEHNLAKLKSYFENRYTTSATKIVYLFEKGEKGFVNKIYIAGVDGEMYERIKTKIDGMIKNKWENKFFDKLPSMEC